MKNRIEQICDVLVFGQLFIDELENLKSPLFSQNLKRHGKETIKLLRQKTNKIFDAMENSRDAIIMYDVNYDLLREINKLSLTERVSLLSKFESIKKTIT